MFIQTLKTEYKKPMLYFCISFCFVLMAGWIPVFNRLDVFMQFWRVEVAASLILAVTLAWLSYQHSDKISILFLPRREMNFIVLPLAMFVLWSALSMFWSPSWKLALSHTLIWVEYLIFYLLIRRVLESPKSYHNLITLLSVLLLVIAAPAIIEYCSYIYLGGTTTLAMRYTKYGEWILVLFPMILVGVLRLSAQRFAIGLAVVIITWLFIISTLGRANLILFVCGTASIVGLVFLFKHFHRYRRKIAWMVLAMVLAPIPIHLITLLTDKASVPIFTKIIDETKISYSNNFRKLMISVALEAIAAHPLIGIGAGNYGMQFNNYRATYADKSPTDGNLAVGENELAERSHNEFLQIFAELGSVGALIFLWFLSSLGIMFLNALKRFRQTSLLPLAALLGLALFLASSAVSSYSFRLMQNGLIFFFVLAVAAKFLLSAKFDETENRQIVVSSGHLKFGYAFGIAACLLLLAHCSIRVASAVYIAEANRTPGIEQAESLYQTASRLDGENPDADYFYAFRLLKNNQSAEAVPYFARTIALGLGTSSVYSYMATAQTLAGDAAAAENTFAEAVRLYPLSPFVRTRYAVLLQNNNRAEEARRQLIFAREINEKSANTWWSLMNSGLSETTRTAYANEKFVQVMDLKPPDSLAAVLTERSIKFPAEKVEFNFAD